MVMCLLEDIMSYIPIKNAQSDTVFYHNIKELFSKVYFLFNIQKILEYIIIIPSQICLIKALDTEKINY